MRAAQVVDKHPADRNQALAGLEPMPHAADDFDLARAAAIPFHRQPHALFSARDKLFRRRKFVPFLARTAAFSVPLRGRRRVKIGVGIKAADQRDACASARTETGQRVRVEIAVATENKMPVREPAQHHREHLAHQFGRCLVTTAVLFVPFRGTVQHDHNRQRPRARRKWKLNENGQHHPFVSPAVSRVGMRRTNGVAMTTLAVNLFALVSVDRVVAGEINGALGNPVLQNGGGQGPRQHPRFPTPCRKYAMKTGRRTQSQCAEHAQDIANGMISGRQNGAEQKRQPALKSKLSKCAGKTEQQLSGSRWYMYQAGCPCAREADWRPLLSASRQPTLL